MEISTMREKFKYYKKIYNNALTTFCMLAVKLLAPTLFNIEIFDQSEEAGMKPTASRSFSHSGNILVCHDSKVQGLKVEDRLI